MSALNDMAKKNIPDVKQPRIGVKAVEKLFSTAEKVLMDGDEELAYVYFMKYFNVVQAIRKLAEYKKNKQFYDDMIGNKNLMTAIQKAEELSASLKSRYEEREAVEVSSKLSQLTTTAAAAADCKDDIVDSCQPASVSVDKPPADGVVIATENDRVKSFIDSTGGITVNKLYQLLQTGEVSVIIMDVRSRSDFVLSHMKTMDCISVPAESLKPGSTVRHIERQLPSDSFAAWHNRKNVDLIVLTDWRGSAPSPGPTVSCLMDALVKWDVETVLNNHPVILEGGYEEWLLCYPTHTTNSNVQAPPSTSHSQTSVPLLTSIDYDVNLDFLLSEEPDTNPVNLSDPLNAVNPTASITAGNAVESATMKSSVPVVDRRCKPSRPPSSSSLLPPPQSVLNNQLGSTNIDSQTVIVNRIHNPLLDKQQPFSVSRELGEQSGTPKKLLNSTCPKSEFTSDGTATGQNIPKKPDVDHIQPQPVPDRTKKPNINMNREQAARLEKELVDLDSILQKKAQETKALADVMRKRRQVEAELEALRHDRLEAASTTSSVESDCASEDNIQASVPKANTDAMHLTNSNSSLRSDDEQQKRFELEQRQQLEEERRRAEAELEQKKRHELEQRKREELEQRERDVEEENKRQQLGMKKREEEMKRQELEQRRRAAEEESKRQELKVQEEQKKRAAEEARKRQESDDRIKAAEMERTKREMEEKRKVAEELEQKRLEAAMKEKAEKELREKQDDKRREVEEQKKAAVSSLPTNWEKRFDAGTQQYYYVNHKTQQTQWQPPSGVHRATDEPSLANYKVPLKSSDAATHTNTGLSRSHSSPNIAKLMQDDEAGKVTATGRLQAVKHQLPVQADRTTKPLMSRNLLMLQTEVSAAKVRNLQPTWGNVGSGLTGLKNLGNTCYMNSTLQCLSNTAPLTVYFLSNNYVLDINRENRDGYRGQVADEYAVLIKALWSGQYRSVAPRDFRDICSVMNSTFATSQHQDSQELLEYLMNGLSEGLNKVRRKPSLPEQDNDGVDDEVAADNVWKISRLAEDSIIVDLFRGQYKSTVMCQKCDKKSVVFEPFMSLPLPIPSPTRCNLVDCLRHFSREEKMTGDCQWYCPRCKCKRDATKRIVIWRLPPILLVILKRFHFEGIWRDKITAHVDFPIEGFDVCQHISGPKNRPAYNLFAISNHYGMLDGGHYTAYCRSPVTSKWYKYDDQEVSEMSTSNIKTSAAYMLFYTSMKMDQIRI
jgi:ubiquitin C-terminal hydrolase